MNHEMPNHHRHMMNDFRNRFFIALGLTAPIIILSPMIQDLFGISIVFVGSTVILLTLSNFIFLYCGWPFLKGSILELQRKQIGMMTLIALAIVTANVYSTAVAMGMVEGEIFFWEVATLIDVMLLGHWIEMRSVLGASQALEKLVKLLPAMVHLLVDGQTKEIKREQLKKDDIVLVKPGEKISTDGIVIEGKSSVNESMLTGESKPITKEKDDMVVGGSVNGLGALTIKVSKTGKESYLSQVIDMVRRAQQSKSRAQGIADRAAFWLTIIAIVVGGSTLMVWIVLGSATNFAIERMVTVMVITCPHALGLAIPLVISRITTISAQNGFLVRNRIAFENARNIDVVVFDKTGTLTQGTFGVTDVVAVSDMGKDEILQKAAAIEISSEHSIAQSIVAYAQVRNIDFYPATDFSAISGQGAQGMVNGERVYVGKTQTDIPENLKAQGKTVVGVLVNDAIVGFIALSDVIRDEAREACKKLKSRGIRIAMITGDSQDVADAVALELGIDDAFARVLPDQKAAKVRVLQEKGNIVAMVGDGINDAPALAQADIGIAIGAGTEIAAETADVILVRDDTRNVVDIIDLSKIMYRKTTQNLAWATGYNVVAIPLAAGVLYNYGIILHPAVGAAIMSLSTIIVAINARLIKF